MYQPNPSSQPIMQASITPENRVQRTPEGAWKEVIREMRETYLHHATRQAHELATFRIVLTMEEAGASAPLSPPDEE